MWAVAVVGALGVGAELSQGPLPGEQTIDPTDLLSGLVASALSLVLLAAVRSWGVASPPRGSAVSAADSG